MGQEKDKCPLRCPANFYRDLSCDPGALLLQVRQHFTQRDLAARLQVDPKTIARWEKRQTDCPVYVEAAILDILIGAGGRLGSPNTRSQNAEIGDLLQQNGYKITGGAARIPEESIKGPDGSMKGGTYVDITAEKNGRRIRVQTVSTLSDGKTLTPREQAAAARIRKAFPNDRLYIIRKQAKPQGPTGPAGSEASSCSQCEAIQHVTPNQN